MNSISDRSNLPDAQVQNATSDGSGQFRRPKTVTFASPLKQPYQTSPKTPQGDRPSTDSSPNHDVGGQFLRPKSVAPTSRSGKSSRNASFRELGQMAEQQINRLDKFQEQILELEVQYAEMIDATATALDPTNVAVLEDILRKYDEQDDEKEDMITDENEKKFIGLSPEPDNDEMK